MLSDLRQPELRSGGECHHSARIHGAIAAGAGARAARDAVIRTLTRFEHSGVRSARGRNPAPGECSVRPVARAPRTAFRTAVHATARTLEQRP